MKLVSANTKSAASTTRSGQKRSDSGLLVMGAAVAGLFGGAEGLIHDLADGTGAATALCAATETTIDLPSRTWPRFRRAGGADILVAQNVAGTDDHEADMVPDVTIDN
jgi:hypothetical protein